MANENRSSGSQPARSHIVYFHFMIFHASPKTPKGKLKEKSNFKGHS